MIEVEKKFQPTEEQLKLMLEGAEFLGEKILHDVYYDYSDYRMFKKHIRLRKRNHDFELKIGDDEFEGVALEIESEEEIKNYFKTDLPLEKFIESNLVVIIEYTTKRNKYKKGDFAIDIDELDFGYKCVEIELLVEGEAQIVSAKEKITDLARKYNFEIKTLPSKRGEYFRNFKPDIYKELYIK